MVEEVRGEVGRGCGVPIGRPIWNTRVYVLDGRGDAVDGGEVQENLHPWRSAKAVLFHADLPAAGADIAGFDMEWIWAKLAALTVSSRCSAA